MERSARISLILAGLLVGCNGGTAIDASVGDVGAPVAMSPVSHDPGDWQTAARASVDRFSSSAGHLQVRSDTNGLPAANAPVDFDELPFVTDGLGPHGERLRYYNFDVQSATPAPMYVLYRNGDAQPMADQLPLVDCLPGDANYSDMHQIVRVTVSNDYTANTYNSVGALLAANLPMQKTAAVVNYPIVPEGSMARFRVEGEINATQPAWYNGTVAFYFIFGADGYTLNALGQGPISPIFVMFQINPGQPNGGPSSGFMKDGNGFSHNVTATLPGTPDYSPLWAVEVVDNANFANVQDLPSALASNILAKDVTTVNCPVGYYYPGEAPTVVCNHAVTWGSYASAVFASNCAECHGPTSNFYFDATSESSVAGYARDIASQIGLGSMPPSGPLPAAEIQTITAYLNCTTP